MFNIDVMFSSFVDPNSVLAEDLSAALTWYMRAAHQGHGQAQNNLGCMYFSGAATDGTPDYLEAFKWFSRSGSKRC